MFFNICNLVTTALAYAASPLVLFTVNVYNTTNFRCLSMTGVVTLGACFFIQALLCTWCFFITIPTWSTHPLVTIAVALEQNLVQRRFGRCMMPVHDKDYPSKSRAPKQRQNSVYQVKKPIMWTLVLLSCAFIGLVLWGGVVLHSYRTQVDGYHVRLPEDWSFLPSPASRGVLEFEHDNPADPDDPIVKVMLNATAEGQSSFLDFGSNWGSSDTELSVPFVLLVTSLIQSVITIALHCAELLVSMVPDEIMWRDAATCKKGADTQKNSVLTVLKIGLVLC